MLGKIALQPQFRWFGRWNEDEQGGIAGVMRRYLRARPAGAARHGAADRDAAPPGQGVPRALHRPAARRRTRARAGGSATSPAAWATARVVIGFEPDSVGTINCLARSRRKARMDAAALRDRRALAAAQRHHLHRGVRRRTGPTTASWPSGCATSGVAKVRGFMLNVTHYDWTVQQHRATGARSPGWWAASTSSSPPRSTAAGRCTTAAGSTGKKYKWRRITVWCHPLRRGLGIAPTTQTGDGLTDAFLYIGRPGYSGRRLQRRPAADRLAGTPTARSCSRATPPPGRGPPRGSRYGLAARAVAARGRGRPAAALSRR